MGTCGNGVSIGMTRTHTPQLRILIHKGHHQARTVCFAVAVGAIVRSAAGRLVVPAARLATGTSSLAFVSSRSRQRASERRLEGRGDGLLQRNLDICQSAIYIESLCTPYIQPFSKLHRYPPMLPAIAIDFVGLDGYKLRYLCVSISETLNAILDLIEQ